VILRGTDHTHPLPLKVGKGGDMEPIKFWPFVLRCLAKSALQTADLFELKVRTVIIGAVLVILGFGLLFLVRGLKETREELYKYFILVPAPAILFLAGLFLYSLFRSPYLIYVEEFNKAQAQVGDAKTAEQQAETKVTAQQREIDRLQDQLKGNQPSSGTVQPARKRVIAEPAVDAINSLSVELRVTCDLKDGEEIPPQEVPWMPMDGATAELQGNAATVQLQFNSPVIFRRQAKNEIVIINRFAIAGDSDIHGHPIAFLSAYAQLVVPVQTIVYSKSFSRIRLAEASMTINGRDVWYYPYKMDAQFVERKGLTITFPLAALAKKLH